MASMYGPLRYEPDGARLGHRERRAGEPVFDREGLRRIPRFPPWTRDRAVDRIVDALPGPNAAPNAALNAGPNAAPNAGPNAALNADPDATTDQAPAPDWDRR
ncbi:hypothetical protein [Streptomyces sp. NRRL S-495]|uniref:hypothetical protein n=1 Tax=Streptomyces sp. NRRL S-495 TaxID=1609133 RepID=UPI0005F949DF|nr:hypothetical protein [Streptomyces sp. NRRL S-495]KJY26705.1 hypothetical protein VR45_36460 [Streptomyces sp. NRRL S-495]